MRSRHLIWLVAAALIVLDSATSSAQGLKPFAPLVEFKDLKVVPPGMVISDSEILLDIRPRAEYEAGHLGNAIWVDVKRAQEIAARPGGLTDRDAWLDWITPLGLEEGKRVRVMDGARQLEAARMWWLLRYLGVEQVGLIDGNFGLWKAQRRPVTQEISAVKPRPFPVDFRSDRLATRDDVLAALRSGQDRIVDARTAEEWAGQKLLSRRGGHMPMACRLEWTNFVDADGRFLSLPKLKSMVEAAGVKPGAPVITHCQGGGRASVDAFVFELLGYSTRNFYLGWSDWGNADETPITATAEATPASPPAEEPKAAAKAFTAEYYYKCQWGRSDEFLALFRQNHLPILLERIKQGNILSVTMTKPRIHEVEAGRWDYRVTIVFRDAEAAFDPATDEAIKVRLFPDQKAYRLAEQRRFEILDAHWDLPIEAVDLDKPVTAP